MFNTNQLITLDKLLIPFEKTGLFDSQNSKTLLTD